MNKIAIIGGGAAGMMAAIAAAESGAKVTLIEKNERLGKKHKKRSIYGYFPHLETYAGIFVARECAKTDKEKEKNVTHLISKRVAHSV